MSRPWIALWVTVAIGVATALVVIATPSTPVPAISNGPEFEYTEASRTLVDVGNLLADDAALELDELQSGHPLLVAIEAKEPAGLLWGAVAIAVALLGTLALVRSGNRFGRHLQWLALSMAAFGVARAMADLAIRSDVPLRQLWFGLADVLWIPIGVILAPLLILTFPNGALVSSRWRWVPRTSLVAALLLLAQLAHPARYDGRALAPHLGIDLDAAALVFTAGIALWFVTLVAAGASLLLRFWRSSGQERMQLSWVAWGMGVALTALVVSTVAQAVGGNPAIWGPVSQAGVFVVLPATVLITIFRYRLYDIDVVVHKSVLLLALTATVALVYAVALVAVAALLPDLDLLPGVLAVAVAAIAFEPIRTRLVAAVDRLVYRRMAEPYDALAGLAADLGATYELDEGSAALARAAASATGADHVEVWVATAGRQTLAAVHPPTSDPPTEPRFDDMTRIVAIGNSGFLGVRLARGETLRPHEAVLLDDLAAAASQFVENLQLRRALADRLAELEQRRAALEEAQRRLDTAVDQASQSLEMDLHDGAQARAVSLSAAIGLARADRSLATLDDLVTAVDDAETAVRRFASGAYPDDLAIGGLAAALRRAVPETSGRLDVASRGRPAAPEVEAALFFVALEAVQNSFKHAPGSNVAVDYSTAGGDVVLQVVDDGPGFDFQVDHPGRGLGSMRARVEALGGRLDVKSRPASGTSVVAEFAGVTAP